MSPEEKKVLMQTFSREEEDRQRRIDKKSLAPRCRAQWGKLLRSRICYRPKR